MVVLVVATTSDPASATPAAAFLAMPGWSPGPTIPEGVESFANGEVRLVRHGRGIVEEDDLDLRWEAATGERVDEVVLLSRHTAVSNRPALTVHPIGVPHLREGLDVPPQGGRPGWAALPNPRIGPWLRLLRRIAADRGLVPEFEITLEGTHHGPVTNTPTLNGQKVLLGIGGGHYAPRHMDIVTKDGVWVGHLLSGYSLPMEEPKQMNGKNGADVGGMWKHSMKVSYEATKAAFPGGEIIAHIDQKSFKGWQKNAITSYLQELNIRVGKPNDFL
uniref:D-aminoacyl-tRNA deacylase n=1 Tax=Leersia perrieri TaxID=77586 RepID=A0A0D9X6W7_9ORYZ